MRLSTEASDSLPAPGGDLFGSPLARAAFEASPAGTVVIAADGTVVAANRAFCALYGLDQETVVGTHYARTGDRLDVRKAGETVAREGWVSSRALAGETVRDVVQTVTNPRTGCEFVGRYNGEPVWEDGQIVAAIMSVEDVTEATRAREAVESALSAAEVGTYRIDLMEDRVWGDANFARLYGLAPKEARGGPRHRLYELVHPDDAERVMYAIGEATLTGEPHEVEYRIVRPDGQVRWLLSRGRAEIDEAGRALRRLGSVVDITSRKEAQETLRRTGETFERLVQNSPFGIYVVDADFRLALVSQGAQKVFANVNPLIGRDFADVLRAIWEESFAGEAIAVFRRTLETGEPFHSPRTVERRSDVEDTEAYDWRVERIAMPDGRFAVVCHFYDLSERLQYETSLRESEARFRAAIGAIGVLWTNTPEGRMEGDQPGWSSLTGQSREEYEGYGWAQAVHPDDAGPTVDAWNEAVRERRTFLFEHRVRRFDGAWRCFAVRAVPVLDARGEVREWVGVHVDVTERLEAEQALRASEARLRLALETARLGTWDHDLETGISVYSEAVGPMLGLPRAELTLAPDEFMSIIHPGDRALVASRILASVERDEPYAVRFRALGQDGQVRWLDSRGELARDSATRRPLRASGVVADVTEVVEAEQALRDSNERLERAVTERTAELTRANRDLDAFAYSVAHDLRAPLRSIVSASRILREDAGDRLSGDELATLDRQSASALRLAKIVDDLLGFARLANAEPKRQAFDLTMVARRVADDVIGRRGASTAIHVQEGMTAEGDPSLVGYVLTNLIDNAVKFSGGKGTVTVGRRDCAFFVQDDGPGFDMAHADKLFVAFERLVDGSIEGTGVGLANVHRIVEKHGGRAWAESEGPGRGATFWFTLETAETRT